MSVYPESVQGKWKWKGKRGLKALRGSVWSCCGVGRRAKNERIWQKLLDAHRSGFLLCAGSAAELDSEFKQAHLPPLHVFSVHNVLLLKTNQVSTFRYILSPFHVWYILSPVLFPSISHSFITIFIEQEQAKLICNKMKLSQSVFRE